jgi:hypothetical protein
MSIDRIARGCAGTLVRASLLQSVSTGFCPLAAVLREAGVCPGAAF